MPIYQREPYRSDLTGTIADLILRQGQIRGGAAQQEAEIRSRAALQQGQNRAQLFGTLGQIAAGAVQDYTQRQQAERDLAPRREMQALQIDAMRRENDAAREADWNRRAAQRAIEAIRNGNKDAVLSELPESVRPLVDDYLNQTAAQRKQRQDLIDAQRVRSAQMIVQFGYDPTAVEIVAALNDDDPETTAAFQALRQDPAGFRKLVDSYAYRGKTDTVSAEDPTKRIVKTSPSGERTVISEGTPEQKPDTRALELRMADALASGNTKEYQRLLGVARDAAAAKRDPNASSSDNEPLIPIIGADGQPVLVRRSDAVGQRPANTREQGRPVPASSAENLAAIVTSIDDLKVLTDRIGSTGASSKIGAMLPNAVTEFTGWGADAKSRQALIDRVKQVIGKALEGGVLRKEDEIKYEKILPTIGDAPSVAVSKLRGLDSALKKKLDREIEALEDAGYEVSRFRARRSDSQAQPKADPLGIR